jgi:TatA/E family protein of Tat protein translocase
MLGIGMQEIIIVLIVALIVIGPKKLPDLARALGRALGEFRKATDDLKENLDINGVVREEKEKLTKELNKFTSLEDITAEEKKEPVKKEPVQDTAEEKKEPAKEETAEDAEKESKSQGPSNVR